MKPDLQSTPYGVAADASTAESASPPPSTLLSLVVNLPERYGLTSIHHHYTGEWVVCIHIRQPGEMLGLVHSLGQSRDINEAAKLAIERCEMKMAMPPPAKAHFEKKEIVPGLNVGSLNL